MFRHDCPLAVETCKYVRAPSTHKNLDRDSQPIYILLSAMSVLVVVQQSLEVAEGLMNHPVHL